MSWYTPQGGQGRVKEIDSIVTSKKDWLFNADDYLKYSSSEDWDILPQMTE
jgi:hypothetical protein